MGMVINKQKNQKWVWRSHIDTSNPDPKAGDFIGLFINSYDAAIFHIPDFVYYNLKIPAYIIPPCINPLHPKNVELDWEFVVQTVSKFGIHPEKTYYYKYRGLIGLKTLWVHIGRIK